MPDIPVGSQIFDLSFHPNQLVVFAGLLNGEIKAFGYDEQGQHEQRFVIRPSKRSCRGLATSEDGARLYAVGKARAIYTVDVETGTIVDSKPAVHQAAVNRIKRLLPNMLVTGDDDGAVKLWDSRIRDAIREYTHHFDFISDFMWMEDKKHVVVTSGDGTLSVIDLRSSKTTPFAQSEDQEDELLSIVPIRGGAKTVVGTQLGILSIFNKSSGWGDCVDRVPGHPYSIDTLCALPSSYPSSDSTILTGSSDGLVRAVRLFPTQLIGAVVDHGEFPVERVAIDMGGEGRWVGSVGHDEVIRLTNLREVFEDEDKADEEKCDDGEAYESEDDENVGEGARAEATQQDTTLKSDDLSDEEHNSSEDEVPLEKKRGRKPEKDPLTDKRKKKRGKNELVIDPSFFSGL